MVKNVWLQIAGLSGATAVMLGAFGAHGLKSRGTEPTLLKVWETATHYHLVHSVALLSTALCKSPNLVGGLFTSGIALFSGSLYLLVLTDVKKLGAITPIGGTLLIAGWFAFAKNVK
mmetsp:Transcript_50685/g.110169  ORF Transcript_50685/g.110169 Transcript_50685/m.110169 type:complete len:117 (-) Transcript_50685:31-381(-)